MPKLAPTVTALMIDRVKRGSSLACGNNLIYEYREGGKKSWSVRYVTREGKRGKVLIGYYPELSLADARQEAERVHIAARTGQPIEGYRTQIKTHQDRLNDEQLEQQRQQQEIEKRRFAVVSEKWLRFKEKSWATATWKKARLVIHDYLQPSVGLLDVQTCKARDFEAVIHEVHARAPTLAESATGYISRIIDYAILQGLREEGRTINVRPLLPKVTTGHQPAITDAGQIGQLWAAIADYPGSHTVKCALQLCAWTGHRPGVVAAARWEQIDLKAATWTVPGEFMKMGVDHIVSLPKQTVAMLQEVHGYSHGSEWVFPAFDRNQQRHINRDALSRALRDVLGFRDKHTNHGWRASLRTLAREQFDADIDVLESQLAHAKRDQIQRAYDRTKFDAKRRDVMQTWADWLDQQAREYTKEVTK